MKKKEENKPVPSPCREDFTAVDIMPRRVYEAKRPAAASGFPPLYNDRQVQWVSSDRTLVQYDSPTIRDGRRYPTTTMEKFLKWAGQDVTNIMPDGEWRSWK